MLTISSQTDLFLHKALLDISHHAVTNSYRLITTNFDNGFELLKNEYNFKSEIAPRLVEPKKGIWRSLVYLHGLCDNDNGLNCGDIVVTSSDFGRAYLTERWASRFVTGLFSRYNVLFIGYSLNDPVLRYIVDAIAADRKSGESIKEIYALADFGTKNGLKENETKVRWESLGITPILFNPRNKFYLFNQTIKEWGSYSKDSFNYSTNNLFRDAKQLKPVKGEFNTERILSFLRNDAKGIYSQMFLKINPMFVKEWLEIMDENEILTETVSYNNQKVNIYLVSKYSNIGLHLPLSEKISKYALYIINNLDNSKTIEWIINKGGVLHNDLKNYIISEFEYSKKEFKQNIKDIWYVLVSLQIPITNNDRSYYNSLLNRLIGNPWTRTKQEFFKKAITPFPNMNKHMIYLKEAESERKDISEFIKIEISLPMSHLSSFIPPLFNDKEHFAKNLSTILLELIQNLKLVTVYFCIFHDWFQLNYTEHLLNSLSKKERNNKDIRSDWTYLVDFIQLAMEYLYENNRELFYHYGYAERKGGQNGSQR